MLSLVSCRISELSRPVVGSRYEEPPTLLPTETDRLQQLGSRQAKVLPHRWPNEPKLGLERESWKNLDMMHDGGSALCTVCWLHHCTCHDKYSQTPLCLTCFDLPCACRAAEVEVRYPDAYMERIPPYQHNAALGKTRPLPNPYDSDRAYPSPARSNPGALAGATAFNN